MYIRDTRGCILEVQEDIYWRYKRMYIGGTRGCILEMQEDVYWSYKRTYIGGTRGYILEIQEDIYWRYKRIYIGGTRRRECLSLLLLVFLRGKYYYFLCSFKVLLYQL